MKIFKLPDEVWKKTAILPTGFYQSLGPSIFETTEGEKLTITYVSPAKQLLDIFRVETNTGNYEVTEFLLDGTLNFIVRRLK